MKKFKKLVLLFLEKILSQKNYRKLTYFFSKKEQKKIYKGLSLEKIFNKIYQKNLWDDAAHNKNYKFFSGAGSHKIEIVKPYIDKISNFLEKKGKLVIVDAGCGDFNIGKNFVKFSSKYYAFDIVKDLIEYNKKKFQLDNLVFEKKDITSDPLPSGDVLLLRQVLQHLDNSSIIKLLKNIEGKYNYLVVTEHVPNKNYEKNLERVSGGFLGNLSGIYLDEPPFKLNYLEKKEILSIPINEDPDNGLVKTFIYKIN